MSWLFLTIASAFLLAFYDYFKKLALHDNAVLPVLFGSVVAGAAVWLPFVVWSALAPDTLPAGFLHVTGISLRSHGLLFAKAALVGTSWLFGYYTSVILMPPMALWLRLPKRHAFHWHWAVPVIGFTLLVSDILYFTAIAQPDALISLISPTRRTSVIVSFLLGILLFREKHVRAKAACVAGIITGVILLA